MWIRLVTASTIAIAVLYARPASAQGDGGSGGWDVSATPRFWYMIVNSNSFSESTTVQKTFETLELPLYGGSVRVAPATFESTDFLLTGFYGTGGVRGKALFASGASADSRTDVARTDIELLVRNKVAASNVSWFYGFRWVFLEEDSVIEPGFTFGASASNRLEEETSFYLGEAGLSFATPFGRSGAHILFANIVAGLGYENRVATNRASAADPDRGGVFPSFDINLGYEFHFLPRASAHLRYRTFILREIIREEFLVLHGPEIGLTMRF